ncbi:MAG: lysine biosynthesis protein LysX [Planctomycetota bacterium]
MRIALLHTRIRAEERLLIEALDARGIETDVIDVRSFVLDPAGPGIEADAVLDRSMSVAASRAALSVLERSGVPCFNGTRTLDVCSDKLATAAALAGAGVPAPRTLAAVGEQAALEAVERIGYPAVIKPATGSWGRLIARVSDRESAEAILEHKFTLGSTLQKTVVVQEYVDKPGRDLRIFVVGGRAIAGIARSSEHWITNTARGGSATGINVSGEIGAISEAAARAVGGGILAIDLLECPRRGLLVNEINHSMEFRNSIDTTGVDIPGVVVEHVLERAGAPTIEMAAMRARSAAMEASA